MKKEIFVLTMSTLFATQLINSNHANASTESVDKNFVVQNQELIKLFQLTMNLRVHQSKC